MKYRTEVVGVGEDVWSSNGKLFDTQGEAKEWLDNLSVRWMGYNVSRIVFENVPKGQNYDPEFDNVYQNFRK